MVAVFLGSHADPASGGAQDAALSAELLQGGSQALILDAEAAAQVGPGQGLGGLPQQGPGAVDQRGSGRGGLGADLEPGGGAIGLGSELQFQGLRRGGGAVLDAQKQALAAGRQIGVGIAEGVQIGAAAQGLSGLGPAFFAGVVNEDDGGVVRALQLVFCETIAYEKYRRSVPRGSGFFKKGTTANNAPHRTALPLRSIAASEFGHHIS